MGIVIIGISSLISFIVFYHSQMEFINYIELIAGIFTVTSVVLVAYRSMFNYFFGVIGVALYGYVSFVFTNTGEWMLNWIVYIPLNLIGIFMWKNHLNTKKQVKIKGLTIKQGALITVALVILTIIYATFLYESQDFFYGFNPDYPMYKYYIDSFTAIASLIAMILMLLRFKEQWLLWILINILTIALWMITYNLAMIIMWSTLLVNSIYGYYNWSKNKD